MTANYPDHSLEFLTQWANSRAMDSPRLRTRAWLVLETLQRRGGLDLAQATVGSAQAAKWLIDFHNMGLVGLMDTPRTGRPRKAATERSASAQWRDARLDSRTGEGIRQRTHRRALPIRTLAPLAQMAALFVCEGLAVLVFTEAALEQHELLKGEWLDVSGANQTGALPQQIAAPNLLHALGAAQQRSKPTRLRPLREQLSRFVSRLHDLCCRYKGQVDVVISARPDEPLLRELLGELRKFRLWEHHSPASPGLLRRLVFHDKTAQKQDLAEFIAPFFGGSSVSAHSPGSRVYRLSSELKDFTRGVLEWHRRSDEVDKNTA